MCTRSPTASVLDSAVWRASAEALCCSRPSTATRMSPSRNPATHAGPPGSTCRTVLSAITSPSVVCGCDQDPDAGAPPTPQAISVSVSTQCSSSKASWQFKTLRSSPTSAATSQPAGSRRTASSRAVALAVRSLFRAGEFPDNELRAPLLASRWRGSCVLAAAAGAGECARSCSLAWTSAASGPRHRSQSVSAGSSTAFAHQLHFATEIPVCGDCRPPSVDMGVAGGPGAGLCRGEMLLSPRKAVEETAAIHSLGAPTGDSEPLPYMPPPSSASSVTTTHSCAPDLVPPPTHLCGHWTSCQMSA